MKSRWKYSLILCIMCLMILLPGETAQASKSVTGTCSYDDAYSVLQIVNRQRKKNGAKALKMDSELLAAAMLRAAETTVKFDHYRPNGTMCFTVSSKVYAENIAWNYQSPEAVMKGWMNSAGHKKNILNKSYKSVGIGCFIKDGQRYWVQCFGYAKGDKAVNPGNCRNTYQVATSASGDTELTASEPINPLTTKLSAKAVGGKGRLTVTWSVKGGVSGYELQISTDKRFAKAETYEAGRNSTGKTIKKYNKKKLQAKKRYYIRIRAYIDGQDETGNAVRQYSKWKQLSGRTK